MNIYKIFTYMLLIILISIILLQIKKCKENYENTLFNKIFLINLDRRNDRLILAKKELHNHNFKFKRVSACDGNNLSEYNELINKYFDKNNNLSNGQIGCALSHIKIWLDVINDSTIDTQEKILILEDDITICNDFVKKYNSFMNKIKLHKLNYDLIVLGLLTRNVKQINPDIYKVYDGYGTHAYMLSKKTMMKNIHLFKNINQPIDHFFSKLYKYNNVYIPKHNLIKQSRNNDSDIGPGENYEQFTSKINNLNRKIFVLDWK